MCKQRNETTENNSVESGCGGPLIRNTMKFRRFPLAGCVLIVLLTVLAYWPALRGGFIWDDDDHLTKNPCIVGSLGVKEIWTTSAARICPLVLTSFWAQHAMWGLNPLPYHLVNILLHAASAVVLWLVLRSLNVRGAWLGAALWVLHPVQVESVAWITELKNTQSGLFYVLAVLFFVKWRQTKVLPEREGGEKFYTFALVCAALAMASKSSTVILPLILGLCGWWVDGRLNWRVVPRLLPFFFFSLVMSGVSMWTQKLEGTVGAEWMRSWPERMVTAGVVVWFYLSKLFWPHPLIFIYPRWKIDASHVVSFLPTLAAVVVVTVLFWFRTKLWARTGLFAFAYFLVALLPVLGLVNHYFLRYSFVGDHFLYLASMGPLALAGAVIWTAFDYQKKPSNIPKLLVCGLLLAVLFGLTWRQTGVYQNSETLWLDTLAKNPPCWIAHNNLGLILMDREKFVAAEAHMKEALKQQPDDPTVLNNLGLALSSQGRDREAVACFEAALKKKPDYVKGHYNLGLSLVALGKTDDAIAENIRAVQLDPTFSDAWCNLGNALAAKGRFDEAVARFLEALRHNCTDARIYSDLGSALDSQDKHEEAIGCYHRALRCDPNFAEAYNNLGVALTLTGRTAEALPSFTAALKRNANYAEAHNNLAYVLIQLGRRDEAATHLHEALRLKPDYEQAKMQLRQLDKPANQ